MGTATKPRKAKTRKAKGRPKHNEAGVYRSGVHAEEIPIRKTARTRARVLLVEDRGMPAGSRWRMGYGVDSPSGIGGGGGAAPSRSRDGFPSRELAIRGGCEAILRLIGRGKVRGSDPRSLRAKMAVEDVTKFRDAVPRPLAANGKQQGALEIVPAAKLNAGQRKTLARCEQVIEQGFRWFVAAGEALQKIHDARLYRETHASFEAYTRDRWGFSKQHAHRLMEAAKVPSQLEASPIGDKRRVLPQTESQVRPLLRVDEDQRPEVWQSAVDRAEKQGHGTPTAAIVEEVAREWTTPPDELPEPPVPKARAKPEKPAEAKKPPWTCPDEKAWAMQLKCLGHTVLGIIYEWEGPIEGRDWPGAREEMAHYLRAMAAEVEGGGEEVTG